MLANYNEGAAIAPLLPQQILHIHEEANAVKLDLVANDLHLGQVG